MGKEFELSIKTINGDENNAVAFIKANKEGQSFQYNDTDVSGSLCIKQVYNYVSKGKLTGILNIVAVIIIAFFSFLGTRKKWKIEYQFLAMAIFTALIYLVTIPVGRVPDETAHYLRAYEVSEGHTLSEKSPEDGFGGRNMKSNIIPADLSDPTTYNYFKLIENKDTTIDSNNSQWYSFWNTALYSPVSYVFQLPGILLTKLFTAKTLAIAYAGRISSMIFSILALFLAIRYIPVKKYLILLVAMMPVFMQEMISLSPDSLINALSIGIVSYAVYLAYNEQEKITNKQIVGMYLMSIVLALTKIVYVPLCFIFYIIPSRKFKDKKTYWKIMLSMSAVAIFLKLLWLALASGYLAELQVGVDSAKQVSNLLMHPFDYLFVALNTLIQYGETYIKTCVGSSLCWFDVNVNSLIIWVYVIVLIVIGKADNQDKKVICNKDKYIMGGIFGVILALTATSLYVQFTKYNARAIEGIQGRYFIPLILVASLVFTAKKTKVLKDEVVTKYMYPFIGLMQVCAVVPVIIGNL